MSKQEALSASYDHVAIIGAGAWGTALAIVAARAGRRVTLLGRAPDVIEGILATRENRRYLPGAKLPAAIATSDDLTEAAEADALLLVIPAQHVRATLLALPPVPLSGKPIVICAKGIERTTGKLMSEVLEEFATPAQLAILSGPSFARDVAIGLPTAVTVAAQPDVASRLQASLGNETFRPYASGDLTGVALGGAAKNVYAIACGIVEGMGLGESARAALLARSFAELCRLGEALHARTETLMGLSGLGDMVLTATSPTSRNFSFGVSVGGGTAASKPHPLAEGVETAPALVARAKRHGVELPIAETTAAILAGTLPLTEVIPRLMSRPLKAE